MWNYSYVFPTLLVLAVFMGYYYTLPRIPVRMNKTFLGLIGIECLVMTMDIISSYADSNYSSYSVWLLYTLNSLYFIAFFARAYMFYIVTASVLRINAVLENIRRRILAIPFILSVMIVLFTPFTKWFYYIDETGYHSAPLYNLLYYVFWFYLLHSFCGIIPRADRLRMKTELQATFWYNVILFVGTIIRMMFPRYLLMDTFCLIAIIMIYLSFLNPDFYMEGRTWIFNSNALRDYLQEINGKKLYSIFAFTIHNFRDISQIYGSKQMEQGIHLICNYLRRNFPEQKLFYCRSGRFAILFEKNYDEERICRQLNKRFGKSWKSEGTEIYADIGCAILDSDMTKLPFETLMILIGTAFSEADKADRFEIKHIGEEHAKHAQREFEIKKAIELAVDNNTAELFLQPIVDARTEIIVGAEALARIRDNEGNIISPELFIPIAEQNGRINQLGSQVFKKVCDFIVNNDMKKLGLSWINVNLSPIQFMRPTLGKDLVVTLQDYDIPHKFLHLEITEAAMADEQLLINQANLINELGFNFVLDDYGKGYSNITRLKNCPFVNVKLDMNIVWDHCARPDEVIPNMVRTFLNMGFEITAEGIEDEAMAKTMQDVGCTYLQGFYYAKPMPAQEFVKKYLKN